MTYRIFLTSQEGAKALQDDDLVNRQTLVVKDGDAWDLDGKVVLVEGTEDAVERAAEIVADVGGDPVDNPEEIKADIDAEEEGAAAGVGALFG